MVALVAETYVSCAQKLKAMPECVPLTRICCPVMAPVQPLPLPVTVVPPEVSVTVPGPGMAIPIGPGPPAGHAAPFGSVKKRVEVPWMRNSPTLVPEGHVADG